MSKTGENQLTPAGEKGFFRETFQTYLWFFAKYNGYSIWEYFLLKKRVKKVGITLSANSPARNPDEPCDSYVCLLTHLLAIYPDENRTPCHVGP
jgi:hypothetical protein